MKIHFHDRRRRRLAVVYLVALCWLAPGRHGFADGIDDVLQRLAEAQSFRLRGSEWVEQSVRPRGWGGLFGQQQLTLKRVPIEIAVKRPGQFLDRAAWVTSYDDGPAEVAQRVHQCDGKREWIYEGDKNLRYSDAVSPLDTLLRAKTIEQNSVESALLGSPDAVYRKVGTENQGSRRLDLYEARYQTQCGTTLARIWLDPKTGLPTRVVHNRLDATGKSAPKMELTEFAVNIPLADEFFHFDESTKSRIAEEPVMRSDELVAPRSREAAQPASIRPILNVGPNAIDRSGSAALAFWYALRISDNAALVFWRRSAPPAQADGVRDWLSNLTMVAPDSRGDRTLRHQWIYQSLSADRWNWSLVVTADGKSLGRSQIRFTLRSAGSTATLAMTPLRLSVDDRGGLLHAAHEAMLPKTTPEVSLPDLQAIADKLASADGAN